jgi:hypothetical protein
MHEGKISPSDMDLLVVTDSPEEAVQVILNAPDRQAKAATPAGAEKHAAE